MTTYNNIFQYVLLAGYPGLNDCYRSSRLFKHNSNSPCDCVIVRGTIISDGSFIRTFEWDAPN